MERECKIDRSAATGDEHKSLYPKLVSSLTCLFVSIVYAYYPVFKTLVMIWSKNEESSHGIFIIPICLLIIWTKRHSLSQIRFRQNNLGIALVGISLLINIFGISVGMSTLSSLSFVSLVAGIIIYLLGFQMFKALAFPIFFLLFMIPIPSQIFSYLTIPLQIHVSKYSVAIAQFMQIPIFREGNVIHLPGYTLQVVHACSGLRSMVSLTALSAIISYMTLKSNYRRMILFVVGIPIAIFVNIIRVVLTIVSHYYLDYNLAEGSAHTFFGMLIFLLALGCLLLIRRVLIVWDRLN